MEGDRDKSGQPTQNAFCREVNVEKFLLFSL